VPDNTVLKYIFKSGSEMDPEHKFDLSRKARTKRLREIYSLVRKHRFFSGITPEEFRAMLEDLGPSFVKIGQTLSTRSEILPKVYCEELEKLQAECDPLSYEQVRQALEDEFGAERMNELFDAIDPEPLGSASLAQVHKARLVSGEVVAVKIQRPGVRVKMAQDIAIMRTLARRATRMVKGDQMLDLNDVVEELWSTFLEETDFLIEADNLEEFARLNKDVRFITCPKVYRELCSESVLVMEYIEGISIANVSELEKQGYELQEIGEKLLDNYATQILDHGFFHADPHPGNILVRDGQIVYIDLGIMGRLSPRDRKGFGNIIHAVGVQSSSELKDALLSFAVQRDNSAIDHARFLADLDIMLSDYGSTEVADLDIGLFLSDVFALTRSSKVTLPASITSVSRGIVTMEGTISPFIQSGNIIAIINNHLKNAQDPLATARDALEDAALDMRRAAKGLSGAAAYSGEALRMLTRGQLKVNMEVLGSEAPMTHLSKIINRLSLAIIVAGLFIGSSLMVFVGTSVTIIGVPALSFFGYLGAFVLSAFVVVDIIRRG
jgi:ubiquinone biosynthesis protein